MSVTRLLQGEKEDFKKVANLLEVAKQVAQIDYFLSTLNYYDFRGIM